MTRIAKALDISESEVIGLIGNEELKAKKIGNKYFVRKEDFEAFMKEHYYKQVDVTRLMVVRVIDDCCKAGFESI